MNNIRQTFGIVISQKTCLSSGYFICCGQSRCLLFSKMCIRDRDKEDALQYYMDYFDEAGPDREADVVRELGSPERIASIIRSDIAGNLKDGGEFTESGYKDERFRDPNYQVVKRFDLPEGREPKWQESRRDDRERQDGRQENVHCAQGSRDSWQENVHGAQGLSLIHI